MTSGRRGHSCSCVAPTAARLRAIAEQLWAHLSDRHGPSPPLGHSSLVSECVPSNYYSSSTLTIILLLLDGHMMVFFCILLYRGEIISYFFYIVLLYCIKYLFAQNVCSRGRCELLLIF